MLSDDVYRAKLERTIASVRAWTGFIADVARVQDEVIEGAWLLALWPTAKRACPLEIVLRNDQRCDITIASETYEDWPLPSLDVILDLIKAVVDGHVVTRRTVSAATGLPLSVASILTFEDGRVLEHSHTTVNVRGHLGGAIECKEVHYLPYRRPG